MYEIVGYTGPERGGLLARMLRRVAHRGPDGEGVHSDPGARRIEIGDRYDRLHAEVM